MADRALNEAFETTGEWFLPEDPARMIAGSLSYSPKWTELHLHEPLRPLRGTIRVSDNDQTYSVIYGITREGEAMTLLNAQRMGQSFNFGSGGLRESERLVTSWLIVGNHLPSDFVYSKVRFRVPGLQVWLSRQIIDQSYTQNEETEGSSLSYVVKSLPKETMIIPTIGASLDWGYDSYSKCDNYSSIAVTISGWVTIKPDVPQAIEWYLKQQSKITTILSLLAGTSMSPDCIQSSIGEQHHKVTMLITLREANYCTYSNFHDFFMMREGMGIEFADVLSRWFEIYPKVHLPSQLALSVLSSDKLWLHVEFLSLMQALEGFHRGLYDGLYTDNSKYDLVKKALGDAIPSDLASDHKDALRSRIRYGNQVSLSKRLNELANIMSEPIRMALFGGKGKLPRSWIDTRNYYTHWDEELRTHVLDNQGMYNANIRMRLFLRTLYLNLMGIPQENILLSLRNTSGSSQHLAQINARESNNTSGSFMSIQEKGT
jgi:hypothetical protein